MGVDGRVKAKGELVDMLRFVDGTALLAESELYLSAFFERIEAALGNRYNMKINNGKTTMFVVKQQGVHNPGVLAGQPLENVEEFIYLGSKITPDRRRKKDMVCW